MLIKAMADKAVERRRKASAARRAQPQAEPQEELQEELQEEPQAVPQAQPKYTVKVCIWVGGGRRGRHSCVMNGHSSCVMNGRPQLCKEWQQGMAGAAV